MLRIAVCDDLQEDRFRLKKDIEAYFSGKEDAIIVGYESGDELVDVMGKKDFDIVFMDVYMEGISGVEASRQIRKMGKNCEIIFTTTSPEHAMAGYEVRASDYLLKPYQQEEVFQALDYALDSLYKTKNSIELCSGGKKVRIPVGEILRICADGKGSSLECAANKVITADQDFTELMSLLESDFLKNQADSAVNVAFVESISEDTVHFSGGKNILLDPEFAEDFKSFFASWVFKRTWEKK